MTVQYSIQKMVSDGTLSTVVLGIQYLQRNDIYMRIAGEETPQSGAPSGYTWYFLDNTTLKITPTVPNTIEVVVYRRTDVDAMYNTYSQNAQFDESTIDENNQQLLYIAQEYLEQGIPGAGVDTIEYLRDDGTYTYYRVRRTDGSYSDEFAVPSACSSTKIIAREALRRSYADAGMNLVAGSFEAGFVLVNTNDVALQEVSGKVFSGAVGTYPAGTGTSGFVDKSWVLRLDKHIDLFSLGLLNSTTVDQSALFNTIMGTKASYYIPRGSEVSIRFDHALEFTADGCVIDFGGATIIDNVQDRYQIDPSLSTGASLVTCVGFDWCGFYNFTYTSLPTRAQGSNVIGADDQYWVFHIGAKNGELTSITRGFKFTKITVLNSSSGLAGFATFYGDIIGPEIDDIEINGEWLYGINLNWSIRSDWGDFGALAHNLVVSNVRGKSNLGCLGFIGTSGNYGVEIRNCEGQDVNAFLHLFNGDLAQSRFNPSVIVNNCNHRIKNATPADNIVPLIINQRYVYPTLPIGTKLSDAYTLNNCNFESNGTSYVFRHFGTKGVVVMNNCRLYGGAPVLATGYPSQYRPDRQARDLVLNDCVLEVSGATTLLSDDGIVFNRGEIHLTAGFVINDCVGTKFNGVEFSGDLSKLWIKSSSADTEFNGCFFNNPDGSKAVLQSKSFGSLNRFVSYPLVSNSSTFGVIGDSNLSAIDLSNYGTSGSINANGSAYTTFISNPTTPVSGTVTIQSPLNGVRYTVIKGTTSGTLIVSTSGGGSHTVAPYQAAEFAVASGSIFKVG